MLSDNNQLQATPLCFISYIGLLCEKKKKNPTQIVSHFSSFTQINKDLEYQMSFKTIKRVMLDKHPF